MFEIQRKVLLVFGSYYYLPASALSAEPKENQSPNPPQIVVRLGAMVTNFNPSLNALILVSAYMCAYSC